MGCFNSKEKANNNPSSTGTSMVGIQGSPSPQSQVKQHSLAANQTGSNLGFNNTNSQHLSYHQKHGYPRAIEQMVIEGGVRDMGTSLIRYPDSKSLVNVRGWFKKRGHMVRTWKTRYFVLAPTSLKYYKKEIDSPPFGEGLKGEVSLKGAIIEVIPPENGSENNMQLHVFGREGEKDLLLDLGKRDIEKVVLWIDKLEWTIRRCTKIYMNDIFKQRTILDNEVIKKLKFFEVWKDTENQKFVVALEKLASFHRPDVCMHYYELDGSVSVRPYTFSLWTANKTDYDPEYMYNLRSIGLKYVQTNENKNDLPYSLSENSFDPSKAKRFSVKDGGYRDHVILKCADIIDIYLASANPASIESPSYSTKCCNGSCLKVRNKILTIETSFCHSIYIELCCLYDYENLFLSLRNIILYLNLNIPTDNFNDTLPAGLMPEYRNINCIQAKNKVSGGEE